MPMICTKEYGPTIDQVMAAIEQAEAWQLECRELDTWVAIRGEYWPDLRQVA